MYLFFKLFLFILSYNQTEKGLSEKISYFLRAQSQTTPPQSPRRAAFSSPDSLSTIWYILLVEHFTVCRKLFSVFFHLIFMKVL